MAVKPSQSGARILSALDKIAHHQPLGVSELARLLSTNVAAAQRAIATLSTEGWIQPTRERPAQWELTTHIHLLAQNARGNHDLRRRARGMLESLWRDTGESVLLIVPEDSNFVVIDVLESAQYLRSAPPLGFVVPPKASATAWAMLPYMTLEQQRKFLGSKPTAAMMEKYAETIARGYAVSRGDVFSGSTNIAAPIFEVDGRTVGAVLLSVPNDRGGEKEEQRLGAKVLATARKISRGGAPCTLSSV